MSPHRDSGVFDEIERAVMWIGIAFAVLLTAFMVFPLLYLAGDFIVLSFTDKTDWRIEDYMCTVPEGCDEFIATRKRAREKKLNMPSGPNQK